MGEYFVNGRFMNTQTHNTMQNSNSPFYIQSHCSDQLRVSADDSDDLTFCLKK